VQTLNPTTRALSRRSASSCCVKHLALVAAVAAATFTFAFVSTASIANWLESAKLAPPIQSEEVDAAAADLAPGLIVMVAPEVMLCFGLAGESTGVGNRDRDGACAATGAGANFPFGSVLWVSTMSSSPQLMALPTSLIGCVVLSDLPSSNGRASSLDPSLPRLIVLVAGDGVAALLTTRFAAAAAAKAAAAVTAAAVAAAAAVFVFASAAESAAVDIAA